MTCVMVPYSPVSHSLHCEVGWSPLWLVDAVTGTEAGPPFSHFSLCIIEHLSLSLLSTTALIIGARQNPEEFCGCLDCNDSVEWMQFQLPHHIDQSLDWMQACCCAPSCNCCCAVICFEQSTITVCKDCRDNATWCSKTWFLRDWAACLYTALACYVVWRSIPGTCVCVCAFIMAKAKAKFCYSLEVMEWPLWQTYVVVVVTTQSQMIPISNSLLLFLGHRG